MRHCPHKLIAVSRQRRIVSAELRQIYVPPSAVSGRSARPPHRTSQSVAATGSASNLQSVGVRKIHLFVINTPALSSSDGLKCIFLKKRRWRRTTANFLENLLPLENQGNCFSHERVVQLLDFWIIESEWLCLCLLLLLFRLLYLLLFGNVSSFGRRRWSRWRWKITLGLILRLLLLLVLVLGRPLVATFKRLH